MTVAFVPTVGAFPFAAVAAPPPPPPQRPGPSAPPEPPREETEAAVNTAAAPGEPPERPRVRMSVEEFLRWPEAGRFELVDGYLVEAGMGAESSWLNNRIGRHLDVFCDRTGAGWVMGSETHYRCFADPDRFRKPDVSFVRSGRFENETPPTGEVRIAPDLAVEVVSPNEEAMALEGKTHEYLSAGVRLIWVVYPQLRSVTIHRADGSLARLREGTPGAVLSGEDVLPGFAVTLAELFRPPVPQPVAASAAPAPPTAGPPTPTASPAAAAPAASSTSVTPPA
jgi:Uma2 family endonuclease